MTRTISLITATVGAALLFAVPANADNWGADKAQRLDALNASSSLEARERALTAKAELTAASDFYADGFAQAVRAQETETVAGPVRDDRFVIDHSQVPVPTTESSAGRDVDWAQIGIGLGLGLVLAFGLFLAMRLTRIRPVAH